MEKYHIFVRMQNLFSSKKSFPQYYFQEALLVNNPINCIKILQEKQDIISAFMTFSLIANEDISPEAFFK